MPTPALTQIKNATKALLTAALPSHQILTDLPRGEAIGGDMTPCVVLNFGDVSYDYRDGQSSKVHRCGFDMEIYEGQLAGISIGDQQQVTVATIVAAFQADNNNLGGRLEDLNFTGAGSGESNAGDIGGIALTGDMTWQTPPGDFFTIIGQSGLFT